MKTDLSHLKEYRVSAYELRVAGTTGHPDAGIMEIPSKIDGKRLRVVFSRGFFGWDHVSVSHPKRVPNWYEMCQIKEAFFDDEEPVMQLHPPKSEWISNAHNCLHLFRPTDVKIPMPPPELVGIKDFDLSKKTEADIPALQEIAFAEMKKRESGETPLGLNSAQMIGVVDVLRLLAGEPVTFGKAGDTITVTLAPDEELGSGELTLVGKERGVTIQTTRLYRKGETPNSVIETKVVSEDRFRRWSKYRRESSISDTFEAFMNAFTGDADIPD